MKPPWSANQLKRLGDALRDNATLPTSLPDYGEVIAWYDDLAATVHSEIEALKLDTLPGVASVQMGSRAKTIETLREKLRREWPIRLPSIQDVAGVRVDADMSLTGQDSIVHRIVDAFGHDPNSIHDLRSSPHSGYRAVHVWLRLEEGRVEVQVRTALQSMWANTYEALADLAGREIRYGGQPTWHKGVPESLRKVPPNQLGIDTLPESLRYVSEHQIVLIEGQRVVGEWWTLMGDRFLQVVDEANLKSELDAMRDDWLSHPLLDSDAPVIVPTDADAALQFNAAVREIEDATVRLLDGLRNKFEQIRNEIGE